MPTLQPGDTLSLDNLGAHKVAGVRAAIEAGEARLLQLPSYSPDFNSIEQIFVKLKILLQTAAVRTALDLWDITRVFTRFTAQDCRNCLAAAGYDNDLAVAT